MGYSLSWLAIKTKDEIALKENLGVQASGETGDFGDVVLTGRSLFPDWYLLVLDDRKLWSEYKTFDFYMLKDDFLQRISMDTQVVKCMVNETAMCSECSIWENGNKVFEVGHASDMESIYHLDIIGQAPEFYADIRKKYFAMQKNEGEEADVDYIFEIPPVVAQTLTGFKHDEMESLEPPVYDFLSFESPNNKPTKGNKNQGTALNSVLPESQNRPWWKFW